LLAAAHPLQDVDNDKPGVRPLADPFPDGFDAPLGECVPLGFIVQAGRAFATREHLAQPLLKAAVGIFEG
jgi:hypothetical protein